MYHIFHHHKDPHLWFDHLHNKLNLDLVLQLLLLMKNILLQLKLGEWGSYLN
jgi:hypothetical protein